MSEGYKLTEWGDIPESWDIVSMADLIKVGAISKIQDGNHGELHPVSSDFVESGVPFIMANCISRNNKLVLDTAKRISIEHAKKLRIGHSQHPDLLLTHKGTVGLTALVEEAHGQIMLTPQVTAYKIKINEIVDRRYLYLFFQSSGFQSKLDQLSKQSTRAYIGITAQQKLQIILPPFSEQQKIASILSTVDEKIEVIDAQISQTQELKKGLMQQLLSKGIGHTKFKSSELGDIPESWEVVKLGQVTTKIGDGLHSTPKYVHKSEYYFINGNNLINGRIFVSEKTKCIDELEFQRHKLTLPLSTVLMSINGTIGNIAYYRGEQVVLGKSAAYITCDSVLNKDFLYYLLQCELIKKYYKNELTGSTISNLSLKSIRQTPIPLPGLDEQTYVANILCNTDDKLSSLQSRKETHQQLKKGLMQQLLTGKIRVNTSHNEPALT